MVILIPVMLIMNAVWGLTGLVWSQLTADVIHSVAALIIFAKVKSSIIKS